MTMRTILIISLLVSLACGSTPAAAHAFLDHADPRVGSSVRTAPPKVTLWFTQKLEPAFSTATVTDAAGQRVDAGVRVDGSTMQVALRALRPGTYRVTWRVFSVDTHTTQGDFSFHVGE